MKTLIVVCLTLLSGASATYSDKYDNIEIKEILMSCRMVVSYIKCLLGETRRCTFEGLRLKGRIAEALQNRCSECTEKQKKLVKYVIGFLVNTQKIAWKKLRALYDPNNEYYRKYQKEYKEIEAAAGAYTQYKTCDYGTKAAVHK